MVLMVWHRPPALDCARASCRLVHVIRPRIVPSGQLNPGSNTAVTVGSGMETVENCAPTPDETSNLVFVTSRRFEFVATDPAK